MKNPGKTPESRRYAIPVSYRWSTRSAPSRTPRPSLRPIAAYSECLERVVIDGYIGCLNNRNTIGLIGPAAKIDLLATLGTERAPRIFGRPQGVLTALRAANLADSHQRLQKVRSKSTSRSQPRALISPAGGLVKRMLRKYLLALTSGIAGSSGLTMTRTIWAAVPPRLS